MAHTQWAIIQTFHDIDECLNVLDITVQAARNQSSVLQQAVLIESNRSSAQNTTVFLLLSSSLLPFIFSCLLCLLWLLSLSLLCSFISCIVSFFSHVSLVSRLVHLLILFSHVSCIFFFCNCSIQKYESSGSNGSSDSSVRREEATVAEVAK